MAEQTVVHMGENSPEQVAYRLMQDVARVENKLLHANVVAPDQTSADRQWILGTYVECVRAVRGTWKNMGV